VKLPSPRGEQGDKLPLPRGDKPAEAPAAGAADAACLRAQQLQQERLVLQKQAEVGVLCITSWFVPSATAGPAKGVAINGAPW
jgi:hypothetical protein